MDGTASCRILGRYSRCLDAAAILGERWSEPGLSLVGVTVADWDAPGFSPMIHLSDTPPGPDVLTHVEAHHSATLTATAPEDSPTGPTLLIPEPEYRNSSDHYDAVLRDQGWGVQDEPLSFNRIEPPLALTPPAGYRVVLSDLSGGVMDRAHRRLLASCFRLSSEKVQCIARMYHETDARSIAVLIQTARDGMTIAAGTVSCLGNVATMTWGCVDADHRETGLHRTLVSGCVTVAASLSVTDCWLATRNPRVRDRWSAALRLMIARKLP